MKAAVRDNLGEALVGLAVVVLAAWFVAYAWNRTGGGARSGGVEVAALFPNASGVNVGTDVRVAGLKVGSVTRLALDPQSYQVKVSISFEPTVKLPSDSTAAITSEGLLGATFIAFTPGGSAVPLKSGDTITDTQGSLDLMSLIGQFINKPSGDAAKPAQPAPAGP
jgi:phospholipid/cholesterol/gamma-HCH transport system substrate-binding protein